MYLTHYLRCFVDDNFVSFQQTMFESDIYCKDTGSSNCFNFTRVPLVPG